MSEVERPGERESVPAPVLALSARVEEELSRGDESLGVPGRPLNRAAPFFVGLTGALGVAVAYALVRGIADVAIVLVIIGMSLFISVGLSPIVERLISLGTSRGAAIALVALGALGVVVAFALAAVPPITHEVQAPISNYPRYKAEILAGHGWAGVWASRLHLTGYLRRETRLSVPVTSGVLGAGKALISISVAVVSVIALTIYFLFALPGVTALWLSLIPRSRWERVALLTDEVFDRVGGFMLGNLITSLISGVGTFLWLLIFGAPYPVLLGLFVALFDLIPMVGATIAGVVVSLVALTKGLPTGIATAAFYLVYRMLEDYLLSPRVMKHTVNVTPGLTIIATLIGGTLLGLVGALVAIPVAATVRLLIEEVAVPRQNQR